MMWSTAEKNTFKHNIQLYTHVYYTYMNLYNKPGMLIISYYLKVLSCKKKQKNIIGYKWRCNLQIY